MARVMFHCICDQCAKHGEEYVSFPICRACGDEVCLDCATDVDADHGLYACLCSRCASDALESFRRVAERLTEWTPDALGVRAEIDATCRDIRKEA